MLSHQDSNTHNSSANHTRSGRYNACQTEAETEIDLQACAQSLAIELPEWCYQRRICVPSQGALTRALKMSSRQQPALMRQVLGTLIIDEAMRWRVSTFIALPHGSRQALKLKSALQALREHRFGRPSLDQMAAAACLTPFHFCRLFKANFGITPGQLIKRQQMLQGADKLVRPHASVAQVAHELDMCPSYFSSQCRLHYGATPRALRSVLTESWTSAIASPGQSQISTRRNPGQTAQDRESFVSRSDVT